MTSRRALLRAAGAGALLAACDRALPAASPVPSRATVAPPTPTAIAEPSAPPIAPGPRAIRIDAARLADGRSASAVRTVSVVLRAGRIVYAGPRDGMPDVRDADRSSLTGKRVA